MAKIRYTSSEYEMDYNQSQVLEAAGHTERCDNVPLVNPTKNKNIVFTPSGLLGGKGA